MARRPDPAKPRYWQQLLDRQRRSGLTVAAFCQSVGVSPGLFAVRVSPRPTELNGHMGDRCQRNYGNSE